MKSGGNCRGAGNELTVNQRLFDVNPFPFPLYMRSFATRVFDDVMRETFCYAEKGTSSFPDALVE